MPPPPPPQEWFAPTLHLVPVGVAVGGGGSGGSGDNGAAATPTTADPTISASARARAALLCKAVAADCLDKGAVLVAAVEPPPGTDAADAGVGPSVRVSVSAAHSDAEVRRVAAALKGAARRCVGTAATHLFVARQQSEGLKRQESQQSLGGGW